MIKIYLKSIISKSLIPISLRFLSIGISFLIFTFSAKLFTKNNFGEITFILSISSILALYISYGINENYQKAKSLKDQVKMFRADNFIILMIYILSFILLINLLFQFFIEANLILFLSICLLINRYIVADYIGSGRMKVSQVSEILTNIIFLLGIYFNLINKIEEYIITYSILILFNMLFLVILSEKIFSLRLFIPDFNSFIINIKNTKYFLGIILGPILSDLYLTLIGFFHNNEILADLRILQRFFWLFIIINTVICNWNFKQVMNSNNKIKDINFLFFLSLFISVFLFLIIFFFIDFFLNYLGNDYKNLSHLIRLISFTGITSASLYTYYFFCIFVLDKKMYFKMIIYCLSVYIVGIILSIILQNLNHLVIIYVCMTLFIPLPGFYLINHSLKLSKK